MIDETLKVIEVGALLTVSDRTVYMMAPRTELPAFGVRGESRGHRAGIDAWTPAQIARTTKITEATHRRSGART